MDEHVATGGLKLREAELSKWDIVSLGEVMLRFDPGEGRIARTRDFHVWEGGGEYNVARGLRRCFGLNSAIVTALVDNPIGRLLEDLMLQGGVDLSHLIWREFDGVGLQARNGLYFLERGFGVRGGLGMMDRAATAVSQLIPGDVDWDRIFDDEGCRCFHTGGVMAALGEGSAALVLEAMKAARRHGTIVSFDCNYRPSLWKSRGGRAASIETNRALMPYVDILFGHEGDVSHAAAEMSNGPVWHNVESFGSMSARVRAEFTNIKILASTVRRPITAIRNDWGAFCSANGCTYEGLTFDNLDILDRVGGGDSFAAGMIYGLMTGKGPQYALDCGLAHGALAMTTAGDSSMVSLSEVERLMSGAAGGTLR